MSTVRLEHDQFQQLARLIAAQLAEPRSPATLRTADQLAKELGVSGRYVYEHQVELGAVRVGSGSMASLRFDLRATPEGMGVIRGPIVQPLVVARNSRCLCLLPGSVLSIRKRGS